MKHHRVLPGKRGPRFSSTDSTAPLGHDSEFITVRFKAKKNRSGWQLFIILRQVAAIDAAILYVYVSMPATWWALQLLSGAQNPSEILRTFPSSLIEGYLGEGLIYDSPLVQSVLNGDTSPRDYALFLESQTRTSTTGCSGMPLFNSEIYNYDFLRGGYQGIVADKKYNVSTLDDMELVVVVVDCSFRQIKLGDPSSVRVYNLVRSRVDSRHLHLITMSLNTQEYEIPQLHKRGPAVVGVLTLVDDMRDDNVKQFYMVATTYPYQRLPNFEVYKHIGITNDSYLKLRSTLEIRLSSP